MLTKFNLYQPAAIDNSLNSYQIIHKIIHEMNLIIDEINNIDSKANEYTDEQIRLLKAEMQVKFDNIENEIVLLNGRIDLTNSNLTTLENAFNDFKIAITSSVNQLTINVANLSDYVAQTESMLISYIDNKIDVLTHLIETLKGVKVFGLNGKLTTVQQAIDDLKNALNFELNFISFKQLKTRILTPGAQIDPATGLTVGDITYANLLSGIRSNTQGGQQIATLYPQFTLSNTAESHTFITNYFYAVRQPFMFLFISIVLAASAHTGSSYYGYYTGVSNLFNTTGTGYGRIMYDKSSTYNNYT